MVFRSGSRWPARVFLQNILLGYCGCCLYRICSVLVAGVSRRKPCVVFEPYPLGRLGGRGADNRGAQVFNRGFQPSAESFTSASGFIQNALFLLSGVLLAGRLVSLYCRPVGGCTGLGGFLGLLRRHHAGGGRVVGHNRHRPCPGARGVRVGRGRAARVGHVRQQSVVRPVLPGLALVGGSAADLYVSARGRRTAHGRFLRSSLFPSPSSLSAWQWAGWA
jgi:hypothetical protein